jgi:predicted RNase H-like HicB family nuclease
MSGTRKPVEYYLGLAYPIILHADPDGGYVVEFPDLEGCMTQIDTLDELAYMAEDARTGWILSEYDSGEDIPLPSYPEEYSGKFNLRLPKSLHRELAQEAQRQEVSLNQYVVALLSRKDAQERVERSLAEIKARLDALSR